MTVTPLIEYPVLTIDLDFCRRFVLMGRKCDFNSSLCKQSRLTFAWPSFLVLLRYLVITKYDLITLNALTLEVIGKFPGA